MINITKAKYYFRWYPSEWNAATSLWWYSKEANRMINYNDPNFFKDNQEQNLIPVPLIDITAIEKEFLTSIERSKDIDTISYENSDFDCSFKKYIDNNRMVNTWHQFEGKKLEKTVIEDADPALADPEDIEDPAVFVKETWFRYEKDTPDVLKGVVLRVPRKTLFAVVGGNGTGKSTLLKTICNTCKPYRGKVLIDGKPVGKYKDSELFRHNLALLPQDPKSLFVKKTVREELLEMLEKGESESRIDEIAALCEITPLLSQHPYDLSGGEQQRAALAKVLLTDPKILLLDEPTKGIDSFFKQQFAAILQKLKERGVTIIMVSHDVEFCAKYADLVSMFFDGSVVTTNTPNQFFSRNSFYTTAANRMSRHVFENAVNNEDVIKLCKENL